MQRQIYKYKYNHEITTKSEALALEIRTQESNVRILL